MIVWKRTEIVFLQEAGKPASVHVQIKAEEGEKQEAREEKGFRMIVKKSWHDTRYKAQIKR